MLTHLRAQHRAIEKGVQNVQSYLSKYEAELSEEGVARLQVEQIAVHVVVLPTHNLVVFKAYTNYLPDPSAATILPLYYHMLDVNDNPETGLAYFSIVDGAEMGEDRDVISVEVKRPLADMSFEEFEACLQAVGEVGNNSINRLHTEFNAPPLP